MRTPQITTKFKKDMKLMIRRNKDTNKIKFVMTEIIEERILDEKYLDHELSGNYSKHRECHIEPDWLLIYTLNDLIEEKTVTFVRTGTHSDLF